MNKNIIKKVGIGVGLGLSLLLPFFAMAASTPLITSPADITNIILGILSWISAIIFTISLIMLLYAAILFLTAGTSQTIHTKAKSVLLYAVIGVAVAILAYSVQPFLVSFFGAKGF